VPLIYYDLVKTFPIVASFPIPSSFLLSSLAPPPFLPQLRVDASSAFPIFPVDRKFHRSFDRLCFFFSIYLKRSSLSLPITIILPFRPYFLFPDSDSRFSFFLFPVELPPSFYPLPPAKWLVLSPSLFIVVLHPEVILLMPFASPKICFHFAFRTMHVRPVLCSDSFSIVFLPPDIRKRPQICIPRCSSRRPLDFITCDASFSLVQLNCHCFHFFRTMPSPSCPIGPAPSWKMKSILVIFSFSNIALPPFLSLIFLWFRSMGYQDRSSSWTFWYSRKMIERDKCFGEILVLLPRAAIKYDTLSSLFAIGLPPPSDGPASLLFLRPTIFLLVWLYL